MISSLNGRGWGTLVALLLLCIGGVATAAEQTPSPRHPAVVIYVGAG